MRSSSRSCASSTPWGRRPAARRGRSSPWSMAPIKPTCVGTLGVGHFLLGVILTFPRHSNTMHLLRSLELAHKESFVLGVKLVRGAYHEKELENSSPYEPDLQLVRKRLTAVSRTPAGGVRLPEYNTSASGTAPVWDEKWETDGAFNGAALMLVDELKRKDPQVSFFLLYRGW